MDDSMNDSTPSTETSVSPVFSFPDPDLTVRSSDKIAFKVHKWILSSASGVFKDMLALDDLPVGTSAPGSVVDVAEDSGSLEAMLRFMYPLPRPICKDMDTVLPLLHVADKYHIPIITSAMQENLIASHFIENDTLRTFAVAKKFNLKRVEEAVLTDLVKDPQIFSKMIIIPPEIDAITIDDILRINYYREHRADKAYSLFRHVNIPILPACECRANFPGFAEGADEPGECESWGAFHRLLRIKMVGDPTLDVAEESIREEVCQDSQCGDARVHLFKHYKHSISLAASEIAKLPWTYPAEYEAHKLFAQKFNEVGKAPVKFEYDQ
ncbi:hypothetical protein SISNIDRAFT_456086 [Sistotremastrum niveocremeum HHB9708]|uniref:BTB domain-containing protein n=1 Tax=Sistotremastrum niveocremeum HHB9708 TaxID=1314777 RepID=A0A164SXY1_9AGAM|nr:hypothetical protein SISNIDRAFT_456086 [Sistotremastrum niveocremeum HHB9708]